MGDMTVDEALAQIHTALGSRIPGDIRAILTALATSSRASGWEEGAGAMREAAAQVVADEAAHWRKETNDRESPGTVRDMCAARFASMHSAAVAIRSLPLPPCPAPGGGK